MESIALEKECSRALLINSPWIIPYMKGQLKSYGLALVYEELKNVSFIWTERTKQKQTRRAIVKILSLYY